MQVVLAHCYLIKQCKYTLANSIQISLSLFFFVLTGCYGHFFHGSSAAEKGTLFHLKNVFGHRSVKKRMLGKPLTMQQTS